MGVADARSAPPVVRDARPGDAPLLAEWMIAMAWETEHKRLDPDVIAPGVRAVFEQPARGRYFVAECMDADDAPAPAACLMLTREWSDWRCGDWWWIQSVYVSPTARRGGVFGALYRDVEGQARANGAVGLRLYVEWENERAQRTYAALGMQQEHYHMYRTGFVAFD